jgi:hypothetical protein
VVRSATVEGQIVALGCGEEQRQVILLKCRETDLGGVSSGKDLVSFAQRGGWSCGDRTGERGVEAGHDRDQLIL